MSVSSFLHLRSITHKKEQRNKNEIANWDICWWNGWRPMSWKEFRMKITWFFCVVFDVVLNLLRCAVSDGTDSVFVWSSSAERAKQLQRKIQTFCFVSQLLCSPFCENDINALHSWLHLSLFMHSARVPHKCSTANGVDGWLQLASNMPSTEQDVAISPEWHSWNMRSNYYNVCCLCSLANYAVKIEYCVYLLRCSTPMGRRNEMQMHG